MLTHKPQYAVLLMVIFTLNGCNSADKISPLTNDNDRSLSVKEYLQRSRRDHATEMLRLSRFFYFGGIRIAEKIYPAEEAVFRLVLGPDPESAFRHVFVNGTTEAKLYAIVGLDFLGSDDARYYAKQLNDEGFTSFAMSGCFRVIVEPAKSSQKILDGEYREYIKKKLPEYRKKLAEELDQILSNN